MRKLLLVLLMLTTPALAIDVEKTVSGPELIGVNESLSVSITIGMPEGGYLERVEDDIPEHFVAAGYPEACEQTESKLVCRFGQVLMGGTTIGYELQPLGVGYGIIGSPRVYYDGGVKTTDFFRQYYVGRPRVDFRLEGKEALLPGEEIVVRAVMENPGSRSVEGARLTINHSGGRIQESFPLSPGESLTKEYSLGEARKEGLEEVRAWVSWGNHTESRRLTVLFVSPDVSVDRTVEARWRLEDKELVGYVAVSYRMSNGGTAPGNVTFLSGGSYVVAPGETRTVSKEYQEKAPAEKASVTDSRGVVYDTYSFEEQVPRFDKGFFIVLYEQVGSELSPWVLLGALLGALYFSSKFKNPNIKAGFLVIALVSGLLLYSQHSVGAFRLPFTGGLPSFPRPSAGSAWRQLPGNLSATYP